MDRKEYQFRHRVEWSDMSENSPSYWGGHPVAVIVGEQRISLDPTELALAEWERDAVNWVVLREDPKISFKYRDWGDRPNSRHGRAGSTLSILAPEGARFVFARRCIECEGVIEEIVTDGDIPRNLHYQRCDECQAALDAELRRIEEIDAQQRAEHGARVAAQDAEWRSMAS
jgi:hypothetical protein